MALRSESTLQRHRGVSLLQELLTRIGHKGVTIDILCDLWARGLRRFDVCEPCVVGVFLDFL